eukprot:TRINITY_DN20637_c0_g1_i1.p1 TRINITY_DN20637_c0_g1~~TRINITY_DN20637_c0_g1_i1.p1  ORF type:complete len:458 (+),score=99.64 TRINITY_DN20637_c0_g1_i1:34-1374(+)
MAPLAKRCRTDGAEGTARASFLERFFAKYEFTCKYMLSTSDSEAWTMEEVLQKADAECKDRWDQLSLGYTESLGDPALLQAIWQHYRAKACQEMHRRGQNTGRKLVDAERYTDQNLVHLTTCVPVEGIFASMYKLLEKDDCIVCQAPAYQALYEIARSKSCNVVEWKPVYDDEGNFWKFDIADLEALLQKHTSGMTVLKMLVLNSPHNPTGACFSQAQFDEIASLLDNLKQDEPPILFSDEMYSEALSSRPSNVAKKNSIVLSGLSKPWGMPGLRMGWLLVENALHFETIAGFRDYTTLCLPPQSETLSIVALRNAPYFLERNREIARRNYDLLQNFLLRHPQWFYPLNQHRHNSSLDDCFSVCLFVRLKKPLGGLTGKVPSYLTSVPEFVEHLAQHHNICLVAGDFFEFHELPCVRMGIGRSNYGEALEQFEKALTSISRDASAS